MNIAIFTELFLPHIGGQELRYGELGAVLADRGHRVDVYCLRHPSTAPETEQVHGVQVFRYPKSADYTRPVFSVFRRRVLPLLRYSWWCRQVAHNGDYDLYVYNQWPLAHILLSPPRARIKTLLDWCEVRHNPLFRVLQRFVPLFAARNMAVSAAVAEHIAHVSRQRVEYVPSGVNTTHYRCLPRQSRQSIVYVGRLKEHKNVSLLIAAFKLMVDAGYVERLVIAGGGPTQERLYAEARQAGIGERVEFLGVISEERKITLLSESLALVLPSRREGFPRVVAEAMASGLPVVTVNYPENGAQDIVRRYRCGVVTEPSDNGLARGIVQVIRNWSMYSEAAIRGSSELDWSKIADRIVKLADDLNGG